MKILESLVALLVFGSWEGTVGHKFVDNRPSKASRQTQAANNEFNPENIAYPCCGWNGDCQNATSTWCHAECGRCTGPCEGVYYASSRQAYETCDGLPTMPPDPKAAPASLNPDNIPYPCCGWDGDCQHPDNVWCHSACENCVGACEGVFYTAPGLGGKTCSDDGSAVVPTLFPTVAATTRIPTSTPTQMPVVSAVPSVGTPVAGGSGTPVFLPDGETLVPGAPTPQPTPSLGFATALPTVPTNPSSAYRHRITPLIYVGGIIIALMGSYF